MLNDLISSSIGQCEEKMSSQLRTDSVLDNLKRQEKQVKERLDNIQNAIKALEETPQVLNVLELLAKTRF